jgi:hypothetical protein
MNTWNLQREILSITHRWYWIVASFLLGAFIGWLLSLVWPGSYRAVQDIYVGLNTHRVTRDLYIADVGVEQFRNLDDYKNWQMEQLNALAFSDAYLSETLNRLQSLDTSWREVDVSDLREMLDISWRNTGDWHFSARAITPDKASQAVIVWSRVVTDEVALAIEYAREMTEIDNRMKAISDELVDLKARQILLQETQKALGEWQSDLKTMTADPRQSPRMHWSLLSLVVNAAKYNLAWRTVLESSPPLGSLPTDYLTWLDQVLRLIETEMALIPGQIDDLNRHYENLAAEYRQNSDLSRGLSGNMEVGQIKSNSLQANPLRPTGVLVLIGGLIGFLVWMIISLAQITRRTE